MYLILCINSLLLFPQSSLQLVNQLQLTRSLTFPVITKDTRITSIGQFSVECRT